mgnify:CR=1 FL=1
MLKIIPGNLLKDWVVVVVDDEDDSLTVAEIILMEYGATVHTSTNGKEGFEIIKKAKPRLVISDLSMPILDGWGLISLLKHDRAYSEIPVIALTAHAMIGDRERAIANGFHNYLTKPLTVDSFMDNLLNLLLDIPELAHHLHL